MKKTAGFTLVEVLIYLALTGLLFSGLFVPVLMIIENIGRNDAQIMIQNEGAFLLAKIEREARGAVFEVNGGSLEIDGIPLNNSNTQVSNLNFASSSDGELETAKFNLSARTVSGKNYSYDFSTVYPIR